MLRKDCQNCNKEFFKKQNVSLKSWNERSKYCSKSCADLFKKGKPSPSPSTTFKVGQVSPFKGHIGLRGSINGHWKGGQLPFFCKTCGEPFQVDRDRADAKTCSLSCHKLYVKTEEFRMRQSNTLREVVSSPFVDSKKVRAMLRTCSRYAIWREKVLKKDDYTCQDCGKRGGTLQADHKKPFVQVCLENKIETYEQAMACVELWDIENGQTLCLACHYKTPTFGSKVLGLLSASKQTQP